MNQLYFDIWAGFATLILAALATAWASKDFPNLLTKLTLRTMAFGGVICLAWRILG